MINSKLYPKRLLSITTLLVLIFGLLPFLPKTFAQTKVTNQVNKLTAQEIIDLGYIPGEVLVKFKKDRINLKTSSGKLKAKEFIKDELIKQSSSNFLGEKKQMPSINGSLLNFDTKVPVDKMIALLKKHSDVESVTPNYVFEFYYTPSESEYTNGNLWALDNDSATVAQSIALNTPDYTNNPDPSNNDPDIQAEDAWGITTGGTTKIVAILDTGLAESHPDFTDTGSTPNLWDGSSCVDENGDSVTDGCPNHGWDYENNNNTIEDGNGHGTHVAGIIGGLHNSSGIAGINEDVTLMIVKVGTHFAELAAVLDGIAFAEENGAHIINASWGYDHDRTGLKTAIESFMDVDTAGRLFITASGNTVSGGKNNDAGLESDHTYPSDYSNFSAGVPDNLISVTATDQADALYSDGNHGITSVDLGAPGTNIMSSYVERTTHLNQDFSSGSSGFTLNDNWAVTDEALYVDGPDYDPDVTGSEAVTSSYDLTDTITETAVLKFNVWCDTESANDYLDVYVATPGETDLKLNSSAINEQNSLLSKSVQILYDSTYFQGKLGLIEYVITGDYVSSSTQFKFVWRTDSGRPSGYRGCYIDDVLVTQIETENKYYYADGTSMAAAYTTGVAALVWNEYPNLSGNEVKQILMDSGDYTSSLNGKTVSENRLNAYRALVLAGQVDAGQEEIFVYPTIHSKTAGGNWNSTSTWEEGTVPTSTDVVEINGTVYLNTNTTIAGLLVNSGKTFKPYSYGTGTYTLTIEGDMANNGTIEDSYINASNYGRLIINTESDLENTGTIENRDFDIDGNLTNSGDFDTYLGITVGGNFDNSGTFDSTITLNGASSQMLESTSSLGSVSVNNDVTITGDLTFSTSLYIYAGKTVTFGGGNTLTINGTLGNDGTIEGGDVIMGGASQNFNGSGTYDVNEITLGGTGTKTLTGDKLINGGLTINSGVTLSPYARRTTYNITVTGDLVNNGSIVDVGGYWYGRIKLYLQADLDNSGTMTNYQTFADWEPVVDADSYEFQLTDTEDVWQTEVSTGTNTFSYIKPYVNDDRRWRWRSIDDGTPSAWSSDKYIN